MIHTDTFIEIGKQHKVCEDYILSGKTDEGLPYIILADGCSSSKQTDMGSRILCFLAQQYIKTKLKKGYNLSHSIMGNWIINNAEFTAKQLGLNSTALDSTLIIAYQNPSLALYKESIKCHLYGDGIITYFDKTGFLIREVKYSKNAPRYLSYNIDYRREINFIDLHQTVTTTYTSFFSNDKNITVDNELASINKPNVFTLMLENEDCGVMIASDGLSSFIKNNKDIIPVDEIMEEFISYKIKKGEFLKRRAKAACNSFEKNGIHHFDDLSMGTFLIGD